MTVTITVDRREPDFFKEKGDDVRELPYGDYEITDGRNTVWMERKTWSDLWKSLKQGRLDRQVFDLTKQSVDYGLVVEKGYLHKKAKSSLYASYHKVNRMAWTIPVIHTLNQQHTWDEITKIDRRMVDGGLRTIKRPVKHVDNSDPKLTVLAGLPGIGPKKAKDILKEYDSPMSAITHFEDWPDVVHGIGPKTVLKVAEVMY